VSDNCERFVMLPPTEVVEVGILNDGMSVLSNPKEAEVKLIKIILTTIIKNSFFVILFHQFSIYDRLLMFI